MLAPRISPAACFWVGLSLLGQTPALEAVRQSELAFARQADQEGIHPAFRTWLQEDAVVFTPRVTTAKAQYTPTPGDPGHLVWFPEAMGLASYGDLAWSFGPWTYAPGKGQAVVAQGHFLSMWRRQSTGAWRVVADIGVPHGAPAQAIQPFAAVLGWDPKGAAPVAPESLRGLTRLEADLAKDWAVLGGATLVNHLAPEARLLRSGALPIQDAGARRQALESESPSPGWEPARVMVSAGGDLGWSYGETRADTQGRRASFLRVWVAQAGSWKVLFDVRLPHPAPSH